MENNDDISSFKDRNRSNGEHIKRLLVHFHFQFHSKKIIGDYIDELNKMIDKDYRDIRQTMHIEIIHKRMAVKNQTDEFIAYVNQQIQSALLNKLSADGVREKFYEENPYNEQNENGNAESDGK